MEVLRHRPRSEIAEIRYSDRRLDIMTLEEFLKALIEGEAVTVDGGKTYFRNENGAAAIDWEVEND